jgi:CheY-like chemotaxis protein
MPPRQFDYRMLIVDDDAVFCELADELFSSLGYTVRCAEDGFEALAMMKQALPDIIICDLNLPKMSGFELLSIIRRRFPQIPVIAMSGAYTSGDVPVGVIADAYLQKGGDHSPEGLVQKIRELLENSPFRASVVKSPDAPVWMPADGKQYFVLTCTNCLRSFSLPIPDGAEAKAKRTARCEFCDSEISYVVELPAVAHARRSDE